MFRAPFPAGRSFLILSFSLPWCVCRSTAFADADADADAAAAVPLPLFLLLQLCCANPRNHWPPRCCWSLVSVDWLNCLQRVRECSARVTLTRVRIALIVSTHKTINRSNSRPFDLCALASLLVQQCAGARTRKFPHTPTGTFVPPC